jgi:hypothetical protein
LIFGFVLFFVVFVLVLLGLNSGALLLLCTAIPVDYHNFCGVIKKIINIQRIKELWQNKKK